MASQSKKLIVIALAALFQPPAMAQSGHTLNSVDTTPGTTAPIAPTDPGLHPGTVNGGAIKLPGSHTSELDKDAGSSKAERKASRKKRMVAPQQEQQLFPNERAPRFDPAPQINPDAE